MTENFFVTGHPIGHSLSPVIQNVFFKAAGLDENYGITDIAPENFIEKLDSFKKCKKGFNVTIPHKIEAFNSVDFKDDYAKKVGAVNTVKVENGKLYGFNTDGIGFIKALEKKGVSVKGKTVCILGAGGAVNSISVKINLCGAKEIIILSRRKKQAELLCKNHGFGIADTLNNLQNYSCDILVNATPVGMYPNAGQSPVEDFETCEFVYDLIYNPLKTEFLKKAEQKGINCDNGLWMLVLQAAASFEIWTEKHLSDKTLDKAYKSALKALEDRK